MKNHHYNIKTIWTGNCGEGTTSYRSYGRDHVISAAGKEMELLGSADPSFLGDASRYNPEELLLASLSACHMLWYLHLCSANKIVVTGYIDQASGTMEEMANGSGRFKEVVLKPIVIVTQEEMIEKAKTLHAEAYKMCFIANAVNFEVKCEGTFKVKS